MTTIADVRTGVNRVFDALGAPSWSNPHADHSVAAEEEYSRVTDPERYHVLMLRLQAWQTVLAKLCDVDVDTMAPKVGAGCSSGGQALTATRCLCTCRW